MASNYQRKEKTHENSEILFKMNIQCMSDLKVAFSSLTMISNGNEGCSLLLEIGRHYFSLKLLSGVYLKAEFTVSRFSGMYTLLHYMLNSVTRIPLNLKSLKKLIESCSPSDNVEVSIDSRSGVVFSVIGKDVEDDSPLVIPFEAKYNKQECYNLEDLKPIFCVNIDDVDGVRQKLFPQGYRDLKLEVNRNELNWFLIDEEGEKTGDGCRFCAKRRQVRIKTQKSGERFVQFTATVPKEEVEKRAIRNGLKINKPKLIVASVPGRSGHVIALIFGLKMVDQSKSDSGLVVLMNPRSSTIKMKKVAKVSR